MRKQRRTYLFMAVSSMALVALLVIQVNWILQSAKIKEDLFNEKANMVMLRTSEALAQDSELCKGIESCVQAESPSAMPVRLGGKEQRKLDSIFTKYMNYYNIKIDYSFVVNKPVLFNNDNTVIGSDIFNQRVDDSISADGLELKLIFPDKKKFILAEMGPMFITSVVLILVVLFLFWRTLLSLIKEKKISESTVERLNNVTHEFKTPLTTIALASKMMVKEGNIHQEEKIRHYSDIISQENEKLLHEIEQVLSLTALERDELPLQFSSINLHEIIERAAQTFALQMESKHGTFVLQLDATPSIIHGDKMHLSNAIINLIENAIKYSTETPHVIISTKNIGKRVELSITDQGIGIAKEYHKRIFEKYFRVPTGDRHDTKGFGLGLAYVQKIVKLHHGNINVKSDVGQGTTFTLSFDHA